jgi:chorismate mutase
MAKSKPKTRESAPSKISQLDHELVRLVQERAKLVLDAAGQSPSSKQEQYAAALDEDVLRQLTVAGHGPLP